MVEFQTRVVRWVAAVFGHEVLENKRERTERFIEEAIELVQACDLPVERVKAMVDHVYSRPVGVVPQEIGGVMVTLAALCHVQNQELQACAYTELNRIENPELWMDMLYKHAAKPRST